MMIDISENDEYFSSLELLGALKVAEEDIAEGRFREVNDARRLWDDTASDSPAGS